MIWKLALTIAGSDSGGGAGIQADLKTFSAHGVYGMSVITSITAQNTMGVLGIEDISPNMVYLQMKAIFAFPLYDVMEPNPVSRLGLTEGNIPTLMRKPDRYASSISLFLLPEIFSYR